MPGGFHKNIARVEVQRLHVVVLESYSKKIMRTVHFRALMCTFENIHVYALEDTCVRIRAFTCSVKGPFIHMFIRLPYHLHSLHVKICTSEKPKEVHLGA